jgi:low affinity Fe/Cu permease
MSERFAALANKAATLAGNYVTFLLALGIVLLWAIAGPLFGFSETWQLVINTGTTIVTFLMVFLIQNTQNRDSMALHLKIDELIRVLSKADNAMIEAEDDSDKELQELKEKYRKLAEKEGVKAVS